MSESTRLAVSASPETALTGMDENPSDCCSTRDEMGDECDDGDDQQQVDKPGCDMKCEEAHSPENQKYKSDNP
jgi:hypothetical protein